MKRWLGIDVGGTKILAVLFDDNGRRLDEIREDTTQEGVDALVAQILNIRDKLDGTRTVSAMGLGMPGAVCPKTQALLWIPNIAGVQGDTFAPALRAACDIPVMIENDLNVAALGEAWQGQGGDPLAFIGLGTGTGMGIVIDGRLCRGYRGAAGEIAYLPLGSHPLTPEAHQKAAFETQLSGAGWIARYRARGGDPARTLADLFAAPDALFADVLAESAQLLAQGILAIAAVLDPEVVCFGGSIGLQADLLNATQAALDNYGHHNVRLCQSQLGQYAGAIGAARAAILQK